MPRRRQRPWYDDDVEVIGDHRAPIRDLYHGFLGMSWWTALLAILACYVGLNVLFALGYLGLGGVANARPGSFADAFYFSIQTLGTIGYGAMYPQSTAANVLVSAESLTGMIATALLTGLAFAKFSLSAARILFTRHVAITPMDGVPTLTFRVGNERHNLIIEATLRVVLMRTERTREGVTFYRMYDLHLVRDRSPALSRSWTVLHRITRDSPLHGETPESLKQKEAELRVTLIGTDDTSLQPVHAMHLYRDGDIVWGARHADILSDGADGKLVLDLRKFHDLSATEPSQDFPYPR